MNTGVCVNRYPDPDMFRLPLFCGVVDGIISCTVKTQRYSGEDWAKWLNEPQGKPPRNISGLASDFLRSTDFEKENFFTPTDENETKIAIFPGNFFPDGEQTFTRIIHAAEGTLNEGEEIKPLKAVLACLTAFSLPPNKVRGIMGFDEIIFVHNPFVLSPLTTNPSAQLLMLKYPPEGGIFLDVFPVDSLNNVTERTGLAFGVFSQGEPRQNS